MSRKLFVAGLFLLLGACASPSLHYSGLVTGAAHETQFRDVASRKVALNDHVVIVTNVAWDGDHQGGEHAVRWNWYEGETLIAERAKTLDFKSPPYRFSRSVPASDLGIGHYRVEVLVDGRRVDEQSFDVVAF